MTKMIESMMLKEDNWYPLDSGLRASISEGHSQDCPVPSRIGSIVVRCSKESADLQVSGGNGDYCWNSCNITDCPTYQLMRIRIIKWQT